MKRIAVIFWESQKWQRRQLELAENFFLAIERAGAIPIGFPFRVDREAQEAILDYVDAVVMTGGADISPILYGEENTHSLGDLDLKRDLAEANLIKLARERKKPLLAICRSMQLANVVYGGSLYQDIEIGKSDSLRHFYPDAGPLKKSFHQIENIKGSFINYALGDKSYVNSMHHQAIKRLGQGLKASSHAKDGIIEAIEDIEGKFLFGLQFHPEFLEEFDYYQDIFDRFVEML